MEVERKDSNKKKEQNEEEHGGDRTQCRICGNSLHKSRKWEDSSILTNEDSKWIIQQGNEGNRTLKFGESTVLVLVEIAGKKYVLSWHVVVGTIRFLGGEEGMIVKENSEQIEEDNDDGEAKVGRRLQINMGRSRKLFGQISGDVRKFKSFCFHSKGKMGRNKEGKSNMEEAGC